MKNNYKIECCGSNINSVINSCKNNEIAIYNLNKLDAKKIEFELQSSDFKKFKKLDMKGVVYKILSCGGFEKIKNILLSRIGVFIGIVLSLMLFYFFNTRILFINVSGLEYTSKEDVLKVLKSNNIDIMASNNINTANIEKKLTETFTFSLVSVVNKGSAVIINIKEELKSLDDDYVEMIADDNMLITSIEVFSGTPNVKVGDIVYKGDVLVYPYVIQNDKKINIKPSAKIKAQVFYTDKFQFKNKEIVLKRTGNWTTLNEDISLGQYKLFSSVNNISYESFEIQESSISVSNYFIPIQICKKIAYELTEVEVENNFDKEKDLIIKNLKDNVYLLKNEKSNIVEEDVIIIPIDGGYIVSYYILCSLELEYN